MEPLDIHHEAHERDVSAEYVAPDPAHRTHICGDAFHQTGSMNERDLTRRGFVTQVAASALPLVPAPAEPAATRLTVVCVGAHPDDPESGCGGTLARYAALGHAVTVVYVTRGERGISGKSLDEAAKIRSAECATACKIIGAKPVFFGQIDGATEVTPRACKPYHTSPRRHSTESGESRSSDGVSTRGRNMTRSSGVATMPPSFLADSGPRQKRQPRRV